MVDDREEPRLHARPGLRVAPGVAPRAEECVLNDVFGERGVSSDAERNRVGHGSVSVVQLFECIEFSGGDSFEPRPVGVIHRRSVGPRGEVGIVHRLMRTGAPFGSPVGWDRGGPDASRVSMRELLNEHRPVLLAAAREISVALGASVADLPSIDRSPGQERTGRLLAGR